MSDVKLVARASDRFADVSISVPNSGVPVIVCTDLVFADSLRASGCSTLFVPMPKRGAWSLPIGTAVLYGGEVFVVDKGCISMTVGSPGGPISVTNMCHVDEKTLSEVAKEVAEVFNIPYVKAAADKIALALYYAAKKGLAELVWLPEKQKKEQKTRELQELEELWQKLLELAKSLPPDQELEVEPE